MVSHLNHCLVRFHLGKDCWEGKSDGSHMQVLHTSLLRQFRFMCPHLRQPRQSAFAFIRFLLLARDFFRNSLHTSRSCAALQSGQGGASDFLSFLFWLLLLAISCDSVAKALTLSLWFLLLKPLVFLSFSGSSLLTFFFLLYSRYRNAGNS